MRELSKSGDLDYTATSALALNSGTIKDAAGNNATLTLASPGVANSLGANKAIVIDGVVPTVSGVNSSTANGAYKVGDTVSVQVNFSEAVTVTGTPQLTLETGTTDRTINYASGSGTSSLTFTYTVQAGDTTADLDYISTSALALNSGTIKDAAGNNATVTLATPGAANSFGANKAIEIDTTAPTTTISTLAFSADTGTSSTDFITNTAAQTISGTLSANLSTGETVYVSLDNGSTWTAATATAGQNTWSLSGQTLTASNTLKVRVSDAAGNNGTAYSQAYVLDTTPPTTTVATKSFSADTGSSSTDFITKTAAQTISGTLSANVAAGEVVYVSLDNGSTWAAATISVGANTWSLSGQTLAGSNTLKVKVTDAAGNDGTVSSQVYVLDTTAPAAPSTPDMTSGTDSGASSTDNITNNTTPIFSGTATANSIVTLYDTDGTTVLGTTTSDGSGNWSITSSTLSSSSHTITAKVTDTASNESVASAGLSITVDTASPTAIALSSNTLSNSASANTAVGTLSSTDATVGDTFTYSLVAGAGSTDNASFSISGNSLVATNPSALSAGSYSVRVRTTDVAGNYFDQTFSITVTSNQAPVVSTPTAIALTDTSSTDTFSNQTGTLSATDADGIASYGIQGGATGGSTVVGATTYDMSKLGTYGTLYVKSSDGSYVYVPNASAINGRLSNTSETFTLTATDNNASPATGTATLTVNITGVNDSPTDIGLTATSVSQSGGANATVGTLSTTDADTGDTHTYTLVSGAGDTNNALFNISGTSLRATNAGSMAPGTYTVRVQTTDAASATYAEAMTITVVDDVAPTVASVAVPTNAWYVAGQNLDFTVNFSESVTVDTTGGTPRMALTVGTTTVYATYLSGSGTSALVFRYTVQANDLDANGIAVGTLALNGGTLADATGNNAVLTLNSVGSTTAVLVDAVNPSAPTTPDLALASDSGTSGTDNVTSNTTPTLTGSAEAGSTVTLYDTDGTVLGTTTATGGNWSITSSTLSSGSHTITAKVTDAAGNVSSASAGLAITIDAVAPSTVALSTTSLADTVATSGSTLATLSATDTSGLTYSLVAGAGDTNNGRFTITGTDLKAGGSNLAAGTYDIRVRATDAAGNYTDQTFTVTVTSGPSVASINRTGASALTNASSVDYTVTYNESVTGVDVSDFVLTATGTAGGTIASISGSGTTYTVTVNSLSGDGTLRLDLNNSGTGIVNAGTQAITGGYTSGQTYTLDTTAPTAPSALDMTVGSDSGISDTDNITSDTTPTVTGGGAEAGATVKLYDTDGTTLLGTITTDGSGNWSITSSALTDGAHTLKAKVTDAAGNTGAASTALTVTIDTTAPSAPSAPDLASASDSGSSSTDNNTSVTTPTLTGSGVDAGATVTLYDTNGTTVLGTATADGSGNWSITSSTLTSGAHTLTTKVTDAAGNTSAASAGLTVTIDTTAPSAPSAPDLASGSDAGTSNTDNITSVTTPTLTGSGVEAGATVKLYDTDGATVLGTATADGSGNWSITSSTLTNGAHTLTTKVTDPAGNTSAASAGLTVTIDTTAPSALGAPDLASGSDAGSSSTDNITNATTPSITGSGAEAGATVKLYDTDGTTLLGTATADGTGNWSITSSALSAGSHTLTTKVTDASGNTSAASTGLNVTVDTTAPTAIALSANTVMDVATGTNTAIATLSSTDTQSVSYALAAGDGTNDAGNASFVIAGGTLQSRSQLTAGTYNIRIGATDAAGNISYQTFTITVGSNTAPVITSGAIASVAENAPITTVVYTATASDADAGQTLSYSLTGTDAGSFDVNASTGVVTLKASANYEAKASYSFNVMATDNGTGRLTDTKAVTVTVTNVNEAPSITSGSTGTVAENAATSTVVYTATATDVDAGQTLRYSLTGTDAGSFDINASSGVVTLKASANYESKASYSFNVVATDNGTGTLTDTKAVTITVTDVNEATTGSVTINGTAKQGETLSVVDTLADEDGVTGKTYKWYADGVLIVGANQGSLTLEQDQVGKVITAEVRYTDLSGRTEVATSAATSAVANLSLPPTQVVTAPLINPITVVQPEPVVDVIPAPVASFMSINTVNSIPVLASGAGLVIAPAALVMESPAQSPSLPVVILGVSNPSSSSTSGLRAVEASRDVVIERGEQATFTLPAGTFVHTDGAARVTLTARLADGRPLPANVKFNPTTGTFTVEAASGEQAEQLQVVVNAVDDKGQTASTTLVIKLKEKARNSSALDLPIKLGKLSLGEQIRLAEKPAGHMAELAALSKAFAASQHARSHT